MCFSCPFRKFFCTSRRRHTILTCDWSSDVCSSDLVRRHRDAAQLLPVIAVVMRERSRGERRTLRDEDVAPALLVERPGDAGTSGGGGKLGGEWVGPHLGQREWCCPRGLSSRGGRENAEA